MDLSLIRVLQASTNSGRRRAAQINALLDVALSGRKPPRTVPAGPPKSGRAAYLCVSLDRRPHLLAGAQRLRS